MKNSNLIILITCIAISIYSCKDKSEPNPVEVIDSTMKIKFRYVMLDSGEVQFYNETKYAGSCCQWYADEWIYTKNANPKIRFQKNGEYKITLRAYDRDRKRKDSTFKVQINTVHTEYELATIKGTIFNQYYEYSSGAVPRNNFYGYGEYSFPRATPMSSFGLAGQYQEVHLVDFMKVQGRDSITMKNNFKVGKQPLAVLEKYPTGNYSLKENGWYLLFTGKNGGYGTGNNNPSESLEILEVKEVYQPPLYPEMQSKAFWVTWHFKADTGERGKIDCIMRMKYVIYEQYFD